MRKTMLKIRWRLLIGAISLVTAVSLTLPAAASSADLGRRVAEIWPNWADAGADVTADIWPNVADLGAIASGDQTDQPAQAP